MDFRCKAERSYTLPVLVDFWAEWCGPCKVLGPILERLAKQHEGEWALAKLDTEEHRAIAAKYTIRSIPNVKLFVDGEVGDEFVGALPEPAVVEWLSKAVPSKYRVQLDGARQLLLEGRASSAQEMLETIIAAEPNNDQAIVLLGQTFLGSDASMSGEGRRAHRLRLEALRVGRSDQDAGRNGRTSGGASLATSGLCEG